MIIDRIRGTEGEPVRLRIERTETGEVIDVTIVRELIRHVTATFEPVADRVARVQITQLVATTVDDLKRVLDEVFEMGVAGVVLVNEGSASDKDARVSVAISPPLDWLRWLQQRFPKIKWSTPELLMRR